ncbi:hypothetical protein NIES4103_25560 [Nostoc sp. NIES-4103]|nr:hypothetical protein NIES4103_25560 [Nostoc sp. NIES-4103]
MQISQVASTASTIGSIKAEREREKLTADRHQSTQIYATLI